LRGFLSNVCRHRRHDFSTGIRLLSSSLNCPRTDASLSAIARSCSSCTTPRRGFKKSPISALLTSSLGKSLTCVCTARATSGVPAPSGSRHRSYSSNYSTICPPLQPCRPSSRPTADGASLGSASTKSSASIRLSFTLLKWGPSRRHISPHLFRHTGAVHLLESGVDPNVIRGWLGHVSLETTNRYAEITMRAKEAALKLCEPTPSVSAAHPRTPPWRDDQTLLSWLSSL
jgi:hypothetical protein